MSQAPLLNKTKIYQLLEERTSPYISIIDAAAVFANEKLLLTPKVFESYTIHDLRHSINIMNYMFSLLDNAAKINDETLVLMIYAALFHDVSMGLNDEEINDIKQNKTRINYQKALRIYGNNSALALSSIVRAGHGERSATFLRSVCKEEITKTVQGINLIEMFSFRKGNEYRISFLDMLADICESHEKSIGWIDDRFSKLFLVDNNTNVDGKYISYLLRIADLLDFDCDRAPHYYKWIRYIGNESIPYFAINQVVAPGDKVIEIDNIPCSKNCSKSGKCGKTKKQLKITGNYAAIGTTSETDRDFIYSKCLEYFEYVEKELLEIMQRNVSNSNSTNCLKMHYKIDIGISKPNELAVSPPRKLEVEYPIVRKLFLGENLYKDKRIGLRELVQNSFDACIELIETYKEDGNIPLSGYKSKIRIVVDEKNNTFTLSDNGIGMSYSTLTNYFLHVGKSIYDGDKYRYSNFHSNHIGHFGIGFFSTFMLSKNVKIRTHYYDSNDSYEVRMAKESEFVTLINEQLRIDPNDGFVTHVQLNLSDVKEVFGTVSEISSYIRDNFLDCGIIIKLIHISSENQQQEFSIDLKKNGGVNICGSTVDLSRYFDNVEVKVLFDETVRTRTDANIVNENNFLYDGSRFDRIDNTALQEFISTLRDSKIVYLRIPKVNCNFFIPKQYYPTSGFPFGYEGYKKNVNLSYPHYPIYGNYTIESFSNDTGIEITASCTAGIQELTWFGTQDSLLFYSQDVEFRRNERTLLINQACGEAWKIDANYLRNVLIPDLHIKIPYLLDNIPVVNINTNINTDGIYSTTDRMNLPIDLAREFSYAIGKALTLYTKERTSAEMLRYAIDEFSKKYYSERSVFLLNDNL